jgi:hypothetical protein
MTALMGNTESRSIYKNFNLANLNSNNLDYTHYMYQKYLQYNKFIPPGEKKYFDHTMYNNVPAVPLTTESKGLFNIFPLDLDSLEISQKKGIKGNTGSTTIGVISTSPLKLELELSPLTPPASNVNWFLTYTFVYLNKINFPGGSNNKQDVTYDYVM